MKRCVILSDALEEENLVRKELTWLKNNFLSLPTREDLSTSTKKSYTAQALRKMRFIAESEIALKPKELEFLAKCAQLFLKWNGEKTLRNVTIRLLSELMEAGDLDISEPLPPGLGTCYVDRTVEKSYRLVISGADIRKVLDVTSPYEIPEDAKISVEISDNCSLDADEYKLGDFTLEITWKEISRTSD